MAADKVWQSELGIVLDSLREYDADPYTSEFVIWENSKYDSQ